jgi:hypothetical protein
MNPTVKEPKKRFMTLKRREACLGWLFVSPALIGFSIFTFGSILYSFYLSMTDYDLVSTPKWVGFDNYIRAFTKDQYFYKYFGNTLYFVVTLVPIVLALSLLLAILINKKTSWVNNIYRVALFLPSITSTVAVSMVWLWIFNPDMGLINNFLMAIGLNDVPMWLEQAGTCHHACMADGRLLYDYVPCRSSDDTRNPVRSSGAGRRQRNPEVFPHHIAAFVEHNVCCHDSSGNRSVQYVRIHLYYDSRRSFGFDQYHDVLHLRTSLQ